MKQLISINKLLAAAKKTEFRTAKTLRTVNDEV
jgi:hypothetical protein